MAPGRLATGGWDQGDVPRLDVAELVKERRPAALRFLQVCRVDCRWLGPAVGFGKRFLSTCARLDSSFLPLAPPIRRRSRLSLSNVVCRFSKANRHSDGWRGNLSFDEIVLMAPRSLAFARFTEAV
jgi:hypothetical protein